MILPQLLAKYGDSSKAFGIGAAICASIGFVFCFLHYYWTEERHVSTAPSGDSANVKFSDILNVFRVNRPFLALCVHGICICTMQYVNSTLGSYIYADVFGDVGAMSSASMLSMVLGIVTMVAVPKITAKLELEKVIRAGLLIAAALYGSLFIVLAVATINPWVYMIWSGLGMAFGSVSIYMQWGLVGTAIDYNEMTTGKRTEGSIYGTFNLSRRIGQTIGNSAAVLALGWIGYDSTIAAAGGVQSAATQMGIKALCVLIPAIFMIGSWCAFKFIWNITPEKRAQIKAFKDSKKQEG